MLDLHTHILPGVDDGARSMDVSRDMLAAARANGTDLIVATPHLDGPLSAEYESTVRNARRALEPHAAEAGIHLLAGFEVLLAPDVPLRLRAGEPMVLGESRAVLVDLPFVDWPLWTEQTLFAMQTEGWQIVLAHPERYPRIQADPKLGRSLAERGIALQVTIGSFAGAFGKTARRTAEALLDLGAVHLVASDAHSAGHRMAAVPRGLERLSSLVGAAGVRQLTVDAPRALLEGSALPSPPSVRRRSLRERLLAVIA